MSSDVNQPEILLHELIPLWLVKEMKDDKGIPRVTSDNPNYDFISFLHQIYGKDGSLRDVGRTNAYTGNPYDYEDIRIRSEILEIMKFLASDSTDTVKYYSHNSNNDKYYFKNYTEIEKKGHYYKYSDAKDTVYTYLDVRTSNDNNVLYVHDSKYFDGMETLLERIRKRIGVLKHNIVSMSRHRIKIYTELYKEILKLFKPDLTEDAINKSLEIEDSMWTRFKNRIKWGTRGSRGKKEKKYDNYKDVIFKGNIPPLSGGKSRKSKKRNNKKSKSKKSRSTKRK